MEKSKRKKKNKREKCSSRRFKKKIRASEVNRHTVVMIDVEKKINVKRMKRKLERRIEPFFPTFKILPRADHREIRNLEEIVKKIEVVDTFWETPEE